MTNSRKLSNLKCLKISFVQNPVLVHYSKEDTGAKVKENLQTAVYTLPVKGFCT